MPFDGKDFVKTDSEVVTVLRKARALIENPELWWRPHAPARTPFCVSNTISEIMGDADFNGSYTPARALLMRAVGVSALGELFNWNDAEGRTHAEVMEAFDRAIILAGGTP